jgi:hypothetical protein
MTIGIFLVGLAVIAVASFFVAAPFFQEAPAARPGGVPESERWERQKRQALAGIREAELDHRMGKLSDEDLAATRGRFEAEALDALAHLEGRTR